MAEAEDIDSDVDEDTALDSFPADPTDQLTSEEESDLVDAEPIALSVSYSGQDFDVDGLVRRLISKDILIPTFGHEDDRISSAGFQRSFVWVRPQMDRFVESLLLGYPIPGIFLVRQADRRYLVLDGQQRLKTLQYFRDGLYEGKEFSLKNVADEFRGLTYKTLTEEQRRLLDDTFLQATIVATDGTPASLEAIYQIFERLNSGGTQLTPHEIRVALFAGPLIDFVEKLNKNEQWRELYGKRSPRLRDQELVLRIIALYNDSAAYRRPLKSFLNTFAARNRDLEYYATDTITSLFASASQLLVDAGGGDILRPRGSQLNVALTEAIFVGLMRRIDSGDDITSDQVAAAVEAISRNPEVESVTSKATADEDKVRTRIDIASRIFTDA